MCSCCPPRGVGEQAGPAHLADHGQLPIAGTTVWVGYHGVLPVLAGSFKTCLVEPQRGRSGNELAPGDAVIRTPDRHLRVFVSSTLGELADERRSVSRAISALRLTPVMFEAGARPHPPQDLYRAYLAQSDVFVGLYWQRYGWVGPGMEISGLLDGAGRL